MTLYRIVDSNEKTVISDNVTYVVAENYEDAEKIYNEHHKPFKHEIKSIEFVSKNILIKS